MAVEELGGAEVTFARIGADDERFSLNECEFRNPVTEAENIIRCINVMKKILSYDFIKCTFCKIANLMHMN